MEYFRFYKNKLPKEHDIVYVKTISISDNGEIFYVELLDYANIDGCISVSNMTRRTKHKEYKRIGLEYPAVVLVSNEGGLMLSKNKVQHSDNEKHKTHYEIAKKIMEYGKIISKFYECYLKENELPITDDMHDNVMTHSIWKYYESLDGELLTKDNLVYIISNFHTLIEDPYFPLELQNSFKLFINAHIHTTLIEMHTTMDIKCYASDAIYELKQLFSTNYNDTYEFDISVKLDSPPIYSMTITGNNQDNMEEYLDQCMADVKQKVNTSHTNFKLVNDKTILKEKTTSLVSFSTHEVNEWFLKSVKC